LNPFRRISCTTVAVIAALRKRRITRTILITTLTALTALAISAQPAAADDPGATTVQQDWPDAQSRYCVTPWRIGVLGQYGAQGYFIDGCTVTVWCPPEHARGCRITGGGNIQTHDYVGHRVTLNSRVRHFFANGTVIGWQDTTCGGSPDICAAPSITAILEPGQSASEQCNGVRENRINSASVLCSIFMEYL
jgi:hypothetical protein